MFTPTLSRLTAEELRRARAEEDMHVFYRHVRERQEELWPKHLPCPGYCCRKKLLSWLRLASRRRIK